MNILNHFYQSFNAVSEKDLVHNTAFKWWSKRWKKLETSCQQRRVFAIILTDLFKVFDCIPHGLLEAKKNAFGFYKKPLSFISTYLYNRKQKTKVGSEFSDFLNILVGVPQGSILEPILFIIFKADLFFINNGMDFASYVDDIVPYVCGQNFSDFTYFLNLMSLMNSNGFMKTV